MAFEKYLFDVSSTKNNIEDVTAWLKENASEYFDSVTCDITDQSITCSTGKKAKLTFKVDASGETTPSLNIVLENGANNLSIYGNGDRPGGKILNGKISCAIKTSSGIVLEYASTNYYNIIITKSNLGTTSIFVMWYGIIFGSSSIGVHLFHACDLINSKKVFGTYFSNKDSATSAVTSVNDGCYYWSASSASGLTVLVPYCFIGDTYAPDMYLTPFSQYPKQRGILNCGGVNYYYNGYVALKE